MKLFLGGGGGGADSIELDKKFVAALDLAKPILYIPIASDPVKYPHYGSRAWIKSILAPLGVENITMWVEEDLEGKTEKDFEQFSGVYIGGGNTYKLLKELKEFGTFDILRTIANRDIPIYGGSAGAIILAKTIIPAGFADKNEVGLTDFSALDLVSGYEVWCHYSEADDISIKEYMQKYDFEKVVAIPETAGLYVTESTIEAVGPSSAKVFEGKSIRDIEPGSLV